MDNKIVDKDSKLDGSPDAEVEGKGHDGAGGLLLVVGDAGGPVHHGKGAAVSVGPGEESHEEVGEAVDGDNAHGGDAHEEEEDEGGAEEDGQPEGLGGEEHEPAGAGAAHVVEELEVEDEQDAEPGIELRPELGGDLEGEAREDGEGDEEDPEDLQGLDPDLLEDRQVAHGLLGLVGLLPQALDAPQSGLDALGGVVPEFQEDADEYSILSCGGHGTW